MGKTRTCIILLALALIASSAIALRNPSSAYCEALGYVYEEKTDKDGNVVGMCDFPQNTGDCSSWDFMSGKCGTDYSYCAKKGYQQKKGTNGAECNSQDRLAECLLCVLPNGTVAEVTSLMNLDVQEQITIPTKNQETTSTMPVGTTEPTESTTVPGSTETVPTTTETPVVSSTTEEPLTSTTEAASSTTEPSTEPVTTEEPRPTSTTMTQETLPAATTSSTEPEKGKGTDVFGFLSYIALVFALLIIAILAVYFLRRKKDDDKDIEKKRLEFERWKQEQDKPKQ